MSASAVLLSHKADWKCVQKAPVLQRSSHTLSISSGSFQAYVFGGELNPREPRDNDVHVIDLQDRNPETRRSRLLKR